MRLAPIALFAYNRPEHLRATLEALAADPLAASSDLHIFLDGARGEAAIPLVAAVRKIAKSARGFRAVEVLERTANAGLVEAITTGVSNLCAAHDRVIVLEDDLITAPGFLTFMNEALEKFRDNPQVMQISGYMYPVNPANYGQAMFLPATSCWGWATWLRAWNSYDPAMRGMSALSVDPVRRRALNLDGAYDYWQMLQDHHQGRINSWGVVWHLSVFMSGGLTLYPPVSLVSNCGFDGSGTHGQANDLGQVRLAAKDSHFVLPEIVETDQAVYAMVKQLIRSSKRGWRHWLKNLLAA